MDALLVDNLARVQKKNKKSKGGESQRQVDAANEEVAKQYKLMVSKPFRLAHHRSLSDVGDVSSLNIKTHNSCDHVIEGKREKVYNSHTKDDK
jgi:hypothetical protein